MLSDCGRADRFEIGGVGDAGAVEYQGGRGPSIGRAAERKAGDEQDRDEVDATAQPTLVQRFAPASKGRMADIRRGFPSPLGRRWRGAPDEGIKGFSKPSA